MKLSAKHLNKKTTERMQLDNGQTIPKNVIIKDVNEENGMASYTTREPDKKRPRFGRLLKALE